jgi:hypothetical protein
MILKAKYALILLMTMITISASAQNNRVLHFMNLPQNHLINPALKPPGNFYIGLPVISGINLSITNNLYNAGDLLMHGPGGDSVRSIMNRNYNIDNFLAKIKDKNSLEPQIAVQLLSLGFSVSKRSYIFLDINERMEGNIILPGDLFALILKGNKQFLGGIIDLSPLGGDYKYYREAGLGFSTNITRNLRFGIKGKLLFGIAGFSIDNRHFAISVNNNYTHTIDADMTVNMSGPVKFNINPDHTLRSVVIDNSVFKTTGGMFDFLSGKHNPGVGLDIGVTYNISDRLMFSAAVTDIGFIRWKKDITNLLVTSRFEFGGLNIVDIINGTKTFEDLGNEMADSLKNAFRFTGTSIQYRENLNYCITLGGSYNLTKNISLGLLSYRKTINSQIRKSLIFSANVNISNAFSSGLSYTISSNHYDYLGAGLAFKTGIFQFYLLSDRIPIMWNKIKTENGDILFLPSNWNVINFHLGMNLVFGKSRKKADKPMLNVDR